MFKEIFDEHYRPLCFYASKYVDMEDAKDITQNVFVELWQRNMKFPTPLALKAYLYTTVHNACMNNLKLAEIHQRHHELIRQEASEADERNYVTDRVEMPKIHEKEIIRQFRRHPEMHQAVHRMLYMEESDVPEYPDEAYYF